MPTTKTSPNPSVEVIDSRLMATLYNPFLWLSEKRGMAARRRQLLAHADGAVLEIGAGTGHNLPHYPADLEQLVLAEPGARMGDRIDLNRAPDGVVPRLERAPAEELPFADASFDTVVSTLVLCTVTDPQRAVAEVARVLRPGGQLLFLEHVGAEPGWRRNLQRRSARAWAAFADGCRCNRPTLETIEAQMRVESVERANWRGMPAIVKPLVWGRAVA
ncbi:MAG TPA: methyltransferase domain-containing protein [Solirubrobacterales bacterium]|nr:methyltransferase domain-containing protein [Solirubrobacterales bacterium]